jgi:hypothetical protein
VNALADQGVADYLNENFVCTFLKVGTFQIINGQKVGGNVASYFCLPDGSVVHAVAGPVNASTFLSESRWAYETRKMAQSAAAKLDEGTLDNKKFSDRVKKSHTERFGTAITLRWDGNAEKFVRLPARLPVNTSKQTQVHWVLAREPLANIDKVSKTVWERILNEKLSDVPVAQR